jgi:hypothetical protein
MRPRLTLTLLTALVLPACKEAPDAPSPEGTENPAVAPVETPPGQRVVPGAPGGLEPGVPGSERAERAWPLASGTCYAFDRYVVRTRPREAAPGEDVLVFRRSGGDARAQCDGPPGEAAFAAASPERAGFFFGLAGDLLLLDEGSGPNGRTVRVVDLTTGQAVHEAAYEEPIQIEGGALVYGMEPEVVETMDAIASYGVECPEAPVWLSEGLAVGLSPQIRFDLAARTSQETGEVLCVPIQ